MKNSTPFHFFSVFLLFLFIFNPIVQSNSTPSMRVKILISDSQQLKTLHKMKMDPVNRQGDWLYLEVDETGFKDLISAGFDPIIDQIDLEGEQANYKRNGQSRDYHTYTSLRQELVNLETSYPNLAQLIIKGQSVQGRDILTLKISDNATVDEAEPEMRWDGTIHGDEKIAMEVAMFLINELLLNYGEDLQITNIVNHREIFITPLVNPDGMEMFTRSNANNVDLNRDYGMQWAAWGGSSAPYSQPETQAMMELMRDNQFIIGISGHAGAEMLIYAWSYIWDSTWDEAQYADIQQRYCSYQIYTGGQSSHVLYYVNGSSKEADYCTSGTFGYTLEMADDKTPPASEISYYCQINREAALDLMTRIGYGIQGVVTDSQTGEPIPAVVEIMEIGWPVYCDPMVGDYHRFVLPGIYNLKVWANDYETLIIPSITVGPDETITVDVQLDRDIDSYAYRAVYCEDTQTDDNNHTVTAEALGPIDGRFYSIGVDGYIVLDMGETTPVLDYPGNDFTVWEGDDTAEGYQVQVANNWQGPWINAGSGTGTTEFDLSVTGLPNARYIKLIDDGDGDASALLPGFDLEAITTSHIVPGCAAMELNSSSYACQDTMQIDLIDADENINPDVIDEVVVHLTSGSDPAGIDQTLTETGQDTSEFRGVAELSTMGSPSILQVQHGDTVQVVFQDENCEGEPAVVIQTAQIDCLPPEISNVNVETISEDSLTITWTTNEPSDSASLCGSSIPPTMEFSDDQMVLHHEVTITELTPCTSYFFYVKSTDACGNEAIDDAAGGYYSAITLNIDIFLDANMDEDPGWSYSGQWAWGTPTGSQGDPSSGYTGQNVVGYNLNGTYTNSLPVTYVTTPGFDCSEANNVYFSFWKWLGIESASYDHATVEISNNGGSSWITLWSHTGSTVTPSSWTYEEYDISEWAGGYSNVKLRWSMGPTDSSVTYCGWNIDDVMVSFTSECSPEPTPTPPDECLNSGDVNGDQNISPQDALMSFQIYLGIISDPTTTEFCSADCNGNTSVTPEDALCIFQHYLSNSCDCAEPI